MHVSNRRLSSVSIWTTVLTLTILAAGCGTGDAQQTDAPMQETTSTSELPADEVGRPDEDSATSGIVEIEALQVSGQTDGDLSSTAVFDDAGLRHIRNDLGAWFNDVDAMSTDVGEVDWASQFVLMAVFDACAPTRTALSIDTTDAVDTATIGWEQDANTDCESLAPHVALFVVPLVVQTSEGSRTFASDKPFDVVGASPIEMLAASRIDGITPIAVFIEEDGRENTAPADGAYFFFERSDELAELISDVVGSGAGGFPVGLQAQTDAVDFDEEFVVAVVQPACAPTAYELTATDVGFAHTKWEEPVSCVWSPRRVIVYVVPIVNEAGVEISPDNLPDVAFDVLEDS